MQQCLRCRRDVAEGVYECLSCGGPAVGAQALAVRRPLDEPEPSPVRWPDRWISPTAAVGTALILVLAANALAGLVALGYDLRQLVLLRDLSLGPTTVLVRHDEARLALEWVLAVTYVIAVVLTMVWFFRVYRNAIRLGSRLPHKPRWAIWSWMVPILWFFRPKQMVDQAWQATDAALPRGNDLAWQTAEKTRWVTVWWTTFLVDWFLVQILVRTREDVTRADTVMTTRLAFLSHLLEAVAATIFALLVWRLNARQAQRVEALQA